MMDDVTVELALAARLEDRHLARGAGRAKRARRKVGMRASVTTLQEKFASLRTVPEMLGLGCRFWSRPRRFSHLGHVLREKASLNLMRQLTFSVNGAT
jgi:hypothetical protein